jgi:hypothetical protein
MSLPKTCPSGRQRLSATRGIAEYPPGTLKSAQIQPKSDFEAAFSAAC